MKTVSNLRNYDAHTPFVSVTDVMRQAASASVGDFSTYAVTLKDKNGADCIAYEEVDITNYFVNRSFPDALVMSAIKLGLGEKGISEMFDLGILARDTLEETIFVPLFVVNDNATNPRVVCAQVVLSMNPHLAGGSPHYARAMMRVGNFGEFAYGHTMNAEIIMDGEDAFGEVEPVADLGYVSPEWTLELLINRSAIWWRDALLEASDEAKLKTIERCESDNHRREWNANFARDTTGKKLIEIAVTGRCPNCNAIEGAIAQDVSPF